MVSSQYTRSSLWYDCSCLVSIDAEQSRYLWRFWFVSLLPVSFPEASETRILRIYSSRHKRSIIVVVMRVESFVFVVFVVTSVTSPDVVLVELVVVLLLVVVVVEVVDIFGAADTWQVNRIEPFILSPIHTHFVYKVRIIYSVDVCNRPDTTCDGVKFIGIIPTAVSDSSGNALEASFELLSILLPWLSLSSKSSLSSLFVHTIFQDSNCFFCKGSGFSSMMYWCKHCVKHVSSRNIRCAVIGNVKLKYNYINIVMFCCLFRIVIVVIVTTRVETGFLCCLSLDVVLTYRRKTRASKKTRPNKQ